jgi:hypothetical protein
MIADMQRARQLAWELPRLGWDVEILCPGSGYQPSSCLDKDSDGFFRTDTIVHSVPEMLGAVFRALGFGSIGWRALVPMFLTGRRLLKLHRYDLVYITTAQNPLFLLGPAWCWATGTPYILDFHDPCYKEGIRAPVWARPGLKHAIAQFLSAYVEAGAVCSAAGMVAVSPAYLETLRRRYQAHRPGWLNERRHATVAFGALPRDLEETKRAFVTRPASSRNQSRIIYVGVGGPVMQRSFSLLCEALAGLRVQHPRLFEQVCIELYGTVLGWKPGDKRNLWELANSCGLGRMVEESPDRVSYRRSIELLLGSDGALILGAEDEGYMPSKLAMYALSGKPLLASLHRDGPAYEMLKRDSALGNALWFAGAETMDSSEAASVMKNFLEQVVTRKSFDRTTKLECYLSSAMARAHAELFETCSSTAA